MNKKHQHNPLLYRWHHIILLEGSNLASADRNEKLWQFYQKYRQQLFCYALSITRRQSLAEDAIHNAFVVVAQQNRKIKNLKAYLFRAVRNAAFAQLKTAQKYRNSQAAASESLLLTTPKNNPGHHCLQNEICIQLSRALEKIQLEQKETIVEDFPSLVVFVQVQKGLAQLVLEIRV